VCFFWFSKTYALSSPDTLLIVHPVLLSLSVQTVSCREEINLINVKIHSVSSLAIHKSPRDVLKTFRICSTS